MSNNEWLSREDEELRREIVRLGRIARAAAETMISPVYQVTPARPVRADMGPDYSGAPEQQQRRREPRPLGHEDLILQVLLMTRLRRGMEAER